MVQSCVNTMSSRFPFKSCENHNGQISTHARSNTLSKVRGNNDNYSIVRKHDNISGCKLCCKKCNSGHIHGTSINPVHRNLSLNINDDEAVMKKAIDESLKYEHRRLEEESQIEMAINLSKLGSDKPNNTNNNMNISINNSNMTKVDNSELVAPDQMMAVPDQMMAVPDQMMAVPDQMMAVPGQMIDAPTLSASPSYENRNLDKHITAMVQSAVNVANLNNSDNASTNTQIHKISTAHRVQQNRLTHHRAHFDFIVGRGRSYPKGYINFPLNPFFIHRNVVYIDPNPDMNADVLKYLDDVDFSNYGICDSHDPDCKIDVRIIFDWSSFYCGALSNLTNTITKIGRRCQILVPLNAPESLIPSEIIRELDNNIFTISIVEGAYPLFDWSKEKLIIAKTDDRDINQTAISNHVNPKKYIRIDGYDIKY